MLPLQADSLAARVSHLAAPVSVGRCNVALRVLRRGLPTPTVRERQDNNAIPTPINTSPGHHQSLRGVESLAPRVRPSVLLAGPRLSDGAGPSRRCQGCFRSPPVCCDGPAAMSFPHRSAQECLVAFDVGEPQQVQRSGGRLAVDQVVHRRAGLAGQAAPFALAGYLTPQQPEIRCESLLRSQHGDR